MHIECFIQARQSVGIKAFEIATAYNKNQPVLKFYLRKFLTCLRKKVPAPFLNSFFFLLPAFFVAFHPGTNPPGFSAVGTKVKRNSAPLSDTIARPGVLLANPENNSIDVDVHTSISTNILVLPNGGIDNATITAGSVYLLEAATGNIVSSNTNGSGGGDAITLVPDSSLKQNTTYIFYITDLVKDLAGIPMVPFSDTFTTGNAATAVNSIIKFDKISLPNTTGDHSSLAIGPDGKLYALAIDGIIKRFVIKRDGTLSGPELLYSLQDEYGTRAKTLAIGLAFDPASTADNPVAWITHSTYVFTKGPDWDGKLSRLSGHNLENVRDVVINLPRSAKDHLTNSIVFGPDGALYFTQASNSAMGVADRTWDFREEHLLSGALLRLDLSRLTTLPLDAKTPDGRGTYNPYLASSPLTIYASGLRNAYDLVWHSNGNLYAPTNGSSAGGNTPASVTGTLRPDGSLYYGPAISSLTNIQQTQHDYLFRIVKGGYYGHPNPLRGEYVMNGGNPTSKADSAQVNAYKKGTLPDPNWRGYAFDFKSDKSPDGIIEYRSNTFNGSLKGKLMVVRYSQDKDIITLTPGGVNNDIISSMEGTSIPGFSGFKDPLDLVEDPANGNIYVAEFGGKGKITLLRPKENIPGFGAIGLSSAGISNDYVSLGDTGISHTIAVKNNGSGNLFVSSINISGINAGDFVARELPAFPLLLRAGSSITFRLTFAPLAAGARNALINIKSDDNVKPDIRLPIKGFGIVQLTVYPNPARDKFTVALPADYHGNITLQLVDISGRIYNTESHTLKNGEFTIEMDISKLSLKAGIYFLKIADERKMRAVKLFIQ